MPSSRPSSAVTADSALVAGLAFATYALFVSWVQWSWATTLVGLPFPAIVVYGYLRRQKGVPATIRQQRVPKQFGGKRFLLVSMPVNHFGEALRWSLDLLGAPYEESDVAGVTSLVFRGRTVPWLVDRSTNSILGSSAQALSYVAAVRSPDWAPQGQAESATFLARDESRRAWEPGLVRLGHAVQGFAYFYLLGPSADSGLTRQLWGEGEPRVPLRHRVLLRISHPLLCRGIRRGFQMPDEGAQTRRRELIEGVIDAAEAQLARSGGPYLFGEAPSYVDVTLCALLGPLVPKVSVERWANARFARVSSIADEPRWPAELREFEREMLERPVGDYVSRTYEVLRAHRFGS